MSIESRHGQFEGTTLVDARTKADAAIANLTDAERATLTEQVIEPGQAKTVRATGKTSEEAKLVAVKRAGALAQVLGCRLIAESESKLVEFEAHGYEQAKAIAAGFVPEGYKGAAIEILQNSKPGILGFGKQIGRYTILCDRPVEVEVQYIDPFKIDCRWKTEKADPTEDAMRSMIDRAFSSAFGGSSPAPAPSEAQRRQALRAQLLGDTAASSPPAAPNGLVGIRRVVDNVVCVECPKCGTDFNRKLVLQEIKKQSPFVLEFANWTTGFVCQVCRADITISKSTDD